MSPRIVTFFLVTNQVNISPNSSECVSCVSALKLPCVPSVPSFLCEQSKSQYYLIQGRKSENKVGGVYP